MWRLQRMSLGHSHFYITNILEFKFQIFHEPQTFGFQSLVIMLKTSTIYKPYRNTPEKYFYILLQMIKKRLNQSWAKVCKCSINRNIVKCLGSRIGSGGCGAERGQATRCTQGHSEGLEKKLMGRRLKYKFMQLNCTYFYISCVLKTKLLIE